MTTALQGARKAVIDLRDTAVMNDHPFLFQEKKWMGHLINGHRELKAGWMKLSPRNQNNVALS